MACNLTTKYVSITTTVFLVTEGGLSAELSIDRGLELTECRHVQVLCIPEKRK